MVSADQHDNELNIILLTGLPGVGKTTMVNRLAEHYVGRGLRVSGITTREVRASGVRIGFKITDLATGREGWLARKNSHRGPHVGSYQVVLDDLEMIGVSALANAATGSADIIIVDEVGPMEMTSHGFRNSLSKVLSGNQRTIATVRMGSNYPEIERIRDKAVRFEITAENRDTIYHKLIELVDEWIGHSGS